MVLFEDPLFFGDPAYPANFHKQKLWLHRASMAEYQARLEAEGLDVRLVRYKPDVNLLRDTMQALAESDFDTVRAADPVDDIARRRLKRAADKAGLHLELCRTPGFINSMADNRAWAKGRKKWLMAEFYKSQRRRLNILVRRRSAGGRPMEL